MPLQSILLRDVEGYYPNIDPRRIQKPHIIKGQNFLWGFDGPYSGFGDHFYTDSATFDDILGDGKHISLFRIRHITYVFCENGVYIYDGGFFKVHFFDNGDFPENTDFYKWSHARVGGFDYFCHPGLQGNILKREDSKTFSEFSENVPMGARAITATGDRLIILGTNQYNWSALSQGDNLEPSLTTGAGAQAISLLGGEPFTVENTGSGFFVFTSAGIIITEITREVGTFSHRILHRDIIPINQLVVTKAENFRTIILTQTGLFESSGTAFQLVEPIMSDYISNHVFPNASIDYEDVNFCLYYNKLQTSLWVGISDGTKQFFDRALVLQDRLKKWGLFNNGFYGIWSLDRIVYSGQDGILKVIDTSGKREQRTDENLTKQIPLNSFIEIGAFRITEQIHTEEMGLVEQFSLGSNAILPGEEIEDWNILDGHENWGVSGNVGSEGAFNVCEENLEIKEKIIAGTCISKTIIETVPKVLEVQPVDFLTGHEDWGIDLIAFNCYDLQLCGSYAALGNIISSAQLEDKSLVLIHETQGQANYSAEVSGIYFSFKLSTKGIPGSLWALKVFEFSGTQLGLPV